VLLVSHDRAFLDNVVTQTIAALGDGHWREYAGGYEDYELACAREAAAQAHETADARARDASSPRPVQIGTEGATGGGGTGREGEGAALAPTRPGRAKLSYKEQRELDALPGRIAALEAEQKTLGARLADPHTYSEAGADLKALNERFAAIETELLECLERWEALETRSG